MPLISNPITPRSYQDLLDLIDRLYPSHYLYPLKSTGPGYEFIQAMARMFARVSLANETLGNDGFFLLANSGAKATGTVYLWRQAAHPDAIDVTVKAGSLLTTGQGGRDFVTTADVTFLAADDYTVLHAVTIEALAVGYEYNVQGQTVTAAGETLYGPVDTVKVLIESPDYGDVTIQVRQVSATAGGKDAALDSLGMDRGVARNPGELDDSYRFRLRSLPDTISPDAVDRAVRSALEHLGAYYDHIETWDLSYQTCYDAPATTFVGSDFDPNLFAFDDTRTLVPMRNCWLDTNDYRGAFIIAADNIQPILDVGMVYYDDPNPAEPVVDATAAAHGSPLTGGSRAPCAYDVPVDLDFGYIQGGYDGFDLSKNAVYKGLFDVLQSIKAYGVSATIELRGQ